jgi:hypothetical protein
MIAPAFGLYVRENARCREFSLKRPRAVVMGIGHATVTNRGIRPSHHRGPGEASVGRPPPGEHAFLTGGIGPLLGAPRR